MEQQEADYITGWIDTTIHDFLSAIDEPSVKHGVCRLIYLFGQ